MSNLNHKFCVAPMMEWTDRHCRTFHRVLSRHALLYTEMVTAEAVLHGDRDRLLGFGAEEHPIALQLGGSDPAKLAEAATIGEAFGYDEINLNVGCPSSRVQEGRFGACLMAEPELVAACARAMADRVRIPVTVKCRIGIDDQDSEADLTRFIATVADAGITTFIVHARKAWLSGLSPKENREIPPLDYGRVYRLKSARPQLTIAINGGIETLEACEEHLKHVDGVMVGRAAYQTPYMLAEVDQRLFGSDAPVLSRGEALQKLLPYVRTHLAQGGRLNSVVRHILGLYHGQPRARLFRRHLSEHGVGEGPGLDVLEHAIALAEGRAQMSGAVAAE
ncbi:tRNA dihydrouridine(20/20a) synthase DusA [Hyphomicrobium sp.]|uniref:tRNA dihydrouridine(20/20a) synthase DusA n=1 Tax=Hyphomicrobium sp. TaxID=82 RepID=UPI002E3259E5|nr:tRNA dihydrouridine(20/20a) synthase DusA [Hyphomicrobium sp.]HEX2842896.1 tRNA dihydrouridine(20/20a) synthase DusA [Hyphomicrobium sp.]